MSMLLVTPGTGLNYKRDSPGCQSQKHYQATLRVLLQKRLPNQLAKRPRKIYYQNWETLDEEISNEMDTLY